MMARVGGSRRTRRICKVGRRDGADEPIRKIKGGAADGRRSRARLNLARSLRVRVIADRAGASVVGVWCVGGGGGGGRWCLCGAGGGGGVGGRREAVCACVCIGRRAAAGTTHRARLGFSRVTTCARAKKSTGYCLKLTGIAIYF